MSKIIYLASPYTHKDPKVQELRYQSALDNAAQYLQKRIHPKYDDYVIYSPIVHCHNLAKEHDLPGDFNFWNNYCLTMLSVCDELHVLTIPGWNESRGVKAEIDYAKAKNIPVFYMTSVFGHIQIDTQAPCYALGMSTGYLKQETLLQVLKKWALNKLT